MGEEIDMTTGEREQPRSILRSAVWQRPATAAHAELVWDADAVTVKQIASGESASLLIEDETVSEGPIGDTTEVVNVAQPSETSDPVVTEIATIRREELARLDAEMAVRRAELATSLDRQRAEAEARIAAAERLEQEAIARRREEAERWWAADHPKRVAERIDTAVVAELSDLKTRLVQADARLREELETRRHEELARLESWRASEHARIEAELASEEQRFNGRLMRQLQEFELQLNERLREQEERLAKRWSDVEDEARHRLASLLDNAFSAGPTSTDRS